MAGPLAIHRRAPLTWPIFCTYAVNSRGFEHGVSAETLKNFKTVLQLHERCYGLGSHVVVLRDMPQFLDKVNAAIRKTGMRGSAGLIDYYDEASYHGAFDPKRIPFHKSKRYEDQREFRIVIQHPQEVSAPFILEIGDISDIAMLTTSQTYNETLEVSLPDGSRA